MLDKKPVKYPRSVFFIVSNEFCERFCYYGMRTILTIYLVDILLYSKPDAKIIYHAFTMLVYFFPILGAMLADSFLGKFRTIFYVSIIYAIGNVILSLSAMPPLELPGREFSMLGLLLIAIGTGGIKPCVAAFGGDQFILPQQEIQLARFFSMFYFSINAGSLLSTAITPILRNDVKCFGDNSCFSLAFGVPGALMVVAIVIFGLGKPLYKIREPAGNMVVKVSKCIGNAISTKWNHKGPAKEHWLDHAEPVYGAKLVAEIKATLKVLILYLPLPVFWALFDQQGTGWTFQARRMDGNIGFYTILPDQVQVVNPLLILAFIPLFEYVLYPFMAKLHICRTPLQRLAGGGVLAAVAFAISACISLSIESENPVLPGSGVSHLRVYNTLPCDIKLTVPIISATDFDIKSLTVHKFDDDLEAQGNNTEIAFSATGDCIGQIDGVFGLHEELSVGYYFKNDKEVEIFEDTVEKNDNGLPWVTTVMYTNEDVKPHSIKINYGGTEIRGDDNTPQEVDPDEYTIKVNDKEIGKEEFKLGGVYVTIITQELDGSFKLEVRTTTAHNQLHMLLLIPQYIVITMAEIMYSITGLEFSYSQAPKSMKSVMQACWLLTTAFGNLIVVIIESAHIFEDESSNFFLYAGIMLVDIGIFALMAMRYKYVETETDESVNEQDDAIEEKKSEGVPNKGFSEE